MPAHPPKSRVETMTELLKAVAWPAIALVVLISFWSPLQRTAEQVPTLVSRSDSITIAGLSLKVSRELRTKASPEVQAVVAKLSRKGIEQVLALSEKSTWKPEDIENGREFTKELRALGLATELPPKELEALHAGYGFTATELGRQTQAFLRAIVAEFVQELTAAKGK